MEDLGGDHRPVAVVVREGVAEHPFGLALGVHIRGVVRLRLTANQNASRSDDVEEVDPEIDRTLDDCLALLLVEHPIASLGAPEAHAAEADPADLHPRRAERRVLHDSSAHGKRKKLCRDGECQV